jgi:hypothetical protein
MKAMVPLSSVSKNADSLVAAIAGFLIIFLFSRHGGIGLDPDGVVYMTSAENLRASGKLVDFAHKPLVEFPSFYPVFLSGIMMVTGLPPLGFGPVLNSLLFAGVIFISGYIMEHFLHPSRLYKWALLSCIVLSPGLLEVYSTIWSETLFIFCLLLFMLGMHRYFQFHSRSTLLVAALIASVAAVTRYAGVTIICTGGILILLDSTLPFLRRLGDVIIYSLVSPLLLLINLTRNYFLNTTVTGARERSLTPLTTNMHDAGAVFYDWIPFVHGYRGAAWLTFILLVFLALLCMRQYLQKKRLTAYEHMATFFSLFHIIFMVVTASISRFETLNSRFMSPVIIPLLWSCSYWMPAVYSRAVKRQKKWMLLLSLFIFCGFQYQQLAADYETWDGVKDAGIPGYTEDQWRYSPTVLFIQKDSLPFQKGYTIYSDANDAIYFFTKREGKFLPHREDKHGIRQFLKDPHCYVVWFDDGDNPDLVSREFLLKVKKMKLLWQFADGSIYGYAEQDDH